MLHRIRKAMQNGSLNKLSGHVEVDETFIGGKARNMHMSKRKHIGARDTGKIAVMGLLERHGGEVRTMVVEGTKRHHLHSEVSKHVEAGSTVYTDALRSYNQLDHEYIHHVINHAEKYVDGQIHTNGIENFWSLLKRSDQRYLCFGRAFSPFPISWTNKLLDSILAKELMLIGSLKRLRLLLANALPTTN